jgi:hypothetical protein
MNWLLSSRTLRGQLSPPSANDPVIPHKLFFSIGEVGTLLGLKPYVLRY